MRPHRPDALGAPRAKVRADDQYRRRLNAVLEEQARAIGQSLHDEAGQLLCAAHLALAEASRDLTGPGCERLGDVKRHLAAVEERLRHIARELHPRVLDEVGFVAALELLAQGFAARHGIDIKVYAKVSRRLPGDVATVLYRVAQEALTNIGRHARATHAIILVAPKSGVVQCIVRDNGVGFDPAAMTRRRSARLGLHGMRERLASLGGVLRIRSESGVGTELTATIPLVASRGRVERLDR
jgi:two-component system, NarL family, sensor histidine kinase UhpB